MWASQYKTNVGTLHQVQRWAVKMIKLLEFVMREAVLFMLGDTKNPTGHVPEPPAVGEPA